MVEPTTPRGPERGREPDGYEFLDAGDGRRLERFGQLVLDRPAPSAADARRVARRWSDADLRFEAGRGWSGRADARDAWLVDIAGLTMELRATSAGGVGLYPEHAANLAWLDARVRERGAAIGDPGSSAGRAPAILNLFAHTGLATLVAARAGAAVAHVDGARTSVAWARRNAALNGLEDRSIRWLVDDALAFVEREARRGRRYDGIVLDPPSFGRGPGGRTWTLRDELPRLLASCAQVAADEAFVLLTAHTTGLDGGHLAAMLDEAFGAEPFGAEAFPTSRRRPEVDPLRLVATSGATLALGWAVRLGTSRGEPRA